VKKEDCNNCVCSNSGDWVCEDNVCGQGVNVETQSGDQTSIVILVIALIFISIITAVLFISNKNNNNSEFNQWDTGIEEDTKKVKLPPIEPPKDD